MKISWLNKLCYTVKQKKLIKCSNNIKSYCNSVECVDCVFYKTCVLCDLDSIHMREADE